MDFGIEFFSKKEQAIHDKFLCVKDSTISKAGQGLFAKCDIKKDEIIGFYKGYYVGHNGKHVSWEDDGDGTFYLLDVQGPFRYCNHSEQENIYFKYDHVNDAFEVYAARDILKGEEIFWDYGYTPTPEDENFSIDFEDIGILSPISLFHYIMENDGEKYLKLAAQMVYFSCLEEE